MKKKEDSRFLSGGFDNHGQRRNGGPVRQVLDGTALKPPPIWLMRQAGRYLPEYRAVREKAGTFLDLCFTPDLAAEVTLQPVGRFDLDAAILFSDILVVPLAMGRRVWFVEGEGPRLDPIDAEGISALPERNDDKVFGPILETVRLVRDRLATGKTLIGFCGAPWTVATYMVAGRGSADQAPARLLAARRPDIFKTLIDRLISVSADYLIAQIAAGADVVQIFDTWAGVLGEREFDSWCIAPTAEIVRRVRQAVPSARVIGFPKGAGLRLERYIAGTGVDGVSLDWTVPLSHARTQLQPRIVVQGNLDPIVLAAGGDGLDDAVRRICGELGSGRFIFNLGHGILPETPVANVERLVSLVRGD